METETILFLMLGLFIGMLIGLFLFGSGKQINLKQEVADDVCFQLTENELATASITDLDFKGRGKLVCEIPSFDETQNIIIKSNSEDN